MPFCVADLPKELLEDLYLHVDIPFALRSTCKAFRNAFTKALAALFDERIRGPVVGLRKGPYETKTAMADVVHDVRLIAWACASGCRWNNTLALCAAAAGREESINYLCEFREFEIGMDLFPVAAAHGHLLTLKWMHRHATLHNNRAWDTATCDAAAENGHLDCLRFAFGHRFPFSSHGLYGAARNGHYVCVEFMLFENARDWLWRRDNCRACEHAARGGHIRVLQLLREFLIGWSTDATEECAKGGHVDCMEWMLQEKCPVDYRYCFDEAARHGHVHMLLWIAARWTPDDPTAAAYFHEELLEDLSGTCHIPVLELAKEWGANFDDDSLITIAAHGGHLETIKWLIEQGAPLDHEAVPESAATGGNLDVLNWVAEQPNMLWGNNLFDGAIQSLHVHVLEWAWNTKKVDGPWKGDSLARKVAQWGNLEMGRWLVDNGFVWGEIATRTNLKMTQALADCLEANAPGA